jgi:hypothetical protein
MSSSPLIPAVIVAAMLTACTSAPITPRADLLGMQAPPGAATRTVTLTPQTQSVKVTGGDVVRFVTAGSEFGWAFNVGPTVSVFPLNVVAPPGSLEREVLVYVEPDPRYHIRADFNDNGR